jgi:tetratricopeptide (TPR) repeat protein
MLTLLAPLLLVSAQAAPASYPFFEGSLEAAQAEAAQRETQVAVHFFPDWSEWSKKQAEDAFADARVCKTMQAFVCVQLDPQEELIGAPMVQRCGVRTFPSVVFLAPDGSPDDLVAGYVPPRAYQRELERIARHEGTIRGLQAILVEAPDDLETRHKLAQKQWDLGDDAGYQAGMDFIKLADPEGKSLPMRRITLWGHQEDIFGCRSSGGVVDLVPLLRFLAEEKHDAIRFEGFTYLAGVYLQLQQPEQARGAYVEAAKVVTDADLPSWGSAVASVFENQKEDLAASEKRFALKMARRAAAAAERFDEDVTVRLTCEFVAAQCFVMQGNLTQAERHLSRAERLAPNNPDVSEELAVLRRQIFG